MLNPLVYQSAQLIGLQLQSLYLYYMKLHFPPGHIKFRQI